MICDSHGQGPEGNKEKDLEINSPEGRTRQPGQTRTVEQVQTQQPALKKTPKFELPGIVCRAPIEPKPISQTAERGQKGDQEPSTRKYITSVWAFSTQSKKAQAKGKFISAYYRVGRTQKQKQETGTPCTAENDPTKPSVDAGEPPSKPQSQSCFITEKQWRRTFRTQEICDTCIRRVRALWKRERSYWDWDNLEESAKIKKNEAHLEQVKMDCANGKCGTGVYGAPTSKNGSTHSRKTKVQPIVLGDMGSGMMATGKVVDLSEPFGDVGKDFRDMIKEFEAHVIAEAVRLATQQLQGEEGKVREFEKHLQQDKSTASGGLQDQEIVEAPQKQMETKLQVPTELEGHGEYKSHKIHKLNAPLGMPNKNIPALSDSGRMIHAEQLKPSISKYAKPLKDEVDLRDRPQVIESAAYKVEELIYRTSNSLDTYIRKLKFFAKELETGNGGLTYQIVDGKVDLTSPSGFHEALGKASMPDQHASVVAQGKLEKITPAPKSSRPSTTSSIPQTGIETVDLTGDEGKGQEPPAKNPQATKKRKASDAQQNAKVKRTQAPAHGPRASTAKPPKTNTPKKDGKGKKT